MSKSNRARSRAVRQRMAETGVGYTRAAREVGSSAGRAGRSGTDVVRAYVRALLSGHAGEADLRDAEIRALQAQGRRIVDGGQIDRDTWEITDWATGAMIAYGAEGLDGYYEAAQRLDPEGTWIHIDHIGPALTDRPTVEGVPTSLGTALADWIGSRGTTDEEVAEFIEWPVDKVSAARRE
ncbi:hypothetical protein ACFQ9R_28700 [Nocardia sp. NPDC056541]|uniref:hypothetical protein n=1 Tax=Nocardia sp. NPDC056541 TaxID=3345860 RepID=UPI00366CF2EE